MPSTQLFTQSGGIPLVSGEVFSGFFLDTRQEGVQKGSIIGGVQLLLEDTAPGPVYVGLSPISGAAVTVGSGGSFSSGGLYDGMKLRVGYSYFVPRSRLVSGLDTIRLGVPAASSGGRLFWDLL